MEKHGKWIDLWKKRSTGGTTTCAEGQKIIGLRRIFNKSANFWAGRTGTRVIKNVHPRWESSVMHEYPEYEEDLPVFRQGISCVGGA
eukprot:8110831-Karenia_brevis.AAC.1